MASSSISSIHTTSFKYDVFLSFRGEDTRTSFVDHLYHALKLENIDTYKDDENLERGKKIGKDLIQAIQDSRIHVIVFSKNYASSLWCLEELVKIIECQETSTEHTVYPIFYDVEPTQVRKQSGEFGKAFCKHESDENVEKWRKALVEATSFSGKDLTVDKYEVEFIKKVVKEISLKLPSISTHKNLIGMTARINDVLSSLNAFPEEFCMIGITGMGGIGKTTLSRVVFDQISFQFEGRSFVANVREISKPDFSGLNKLQQQVLRDVSNDQCINIDNVFDGKDMMRKKMPGRKVLVVLDDVDDVEQLKALAGERDWFKPGSKVIITTRNKQVLLAHKVNSIHDVSLLTDEEAICLLSRCAFGTEIPSPGYKELSEEVVSYAAGLPLTITILGSTLYGETKHVWKDTLKELEKIPLDGTLQRLELSYKGLDTNCQEIFLDIACILKGWKKEKAIQVLESCGFHAMRGLSVLEKKSLITTRDGRLDMHDHLQEMGRYIVRRLHPDEPNKHSRLWIEEEILDILASDQGTNEAIRCIQLFSWKINQEVLLKGFGNMKQLRFLHVFDEDFVGKYWTSNKDEDCSNNNREFDEVLQYFPNALRWMCWEGYPSRSLPKSFQANNLVALEILDSSIEQLWEYGDTKVLNKLRFLNLEFLKLKNLDLGLTPNLERLCLKGCYDLAKLHVPFECPKLIYLKVCHSKLRELDLRGTPNLEKLHLKKCFDLVKLRFPVECLMLESVDIYGSRLWRLDLRGTPNIKKLHLQKCVDLVKLHIPVECLKLVSIYISGLLLRTLELPPNLEELYLEKCVDLIELHIPAECLKLESVKIYSSKLRALDLRGTPNIKKLHLEECVDLVELHIPVECLKLVFIYINGSKLRTLDLPLNLEELYLEKCVDLVELQIPIKCLKLVSIHINGSMLRTLVLRGTPNIEKLHLEECVDLVELHIPVECLKLKSIYIDGSELISLDLGRTPNLKSLHLKRCSHLVELRTPIGGLKKLIHLESKGFLRFTDIEILNKGGLPELTLFVKSVDICPLHLDNNFPKFQFECSYEEDLPSSIGNVEKLISIGFSCACRDLESFYGSICGLQNITNLTLHGSIPEAPKDLDRLQCLQMITLRSTSIKRLSDSILFLKHLKVLRLIGCKLLEKLPKDLCRLEYLEMLVVTECIVLQDIPNSICTMKCLKYFHLCYCNRVKELPEELGRLECLEELDIRGTCINDIPQSVLLLKKGLRIVGSMELLEFYKSLPEIKITHLGTHGYMDL